MEPLTIKTPADVLSFVGHTLGFWPQESLVCITLADNHVGPTLRVDLPKPRTEISYAKMVAGYLGHDTSTEDVIFAVYTSEPTNGDQKPQAATIAALTGALAERGLTIREGFLVGDQTVSQYDGDPDAGVRLSISATKSSQINAEFVYRGSTVEPTNRITLPASTKELQTLDAVESRVAAVQRRNHRDAMEQARTLWTECWVRKHTRTTSKPSAGSRTSSSPPSATNSWPTSPESTNPWTGSSGPKHTATRSGHPSHGPSYYSSTPTRPVPQFTRLQL